MNCELIAALNQGKYYLDTCISRDNWEITYLGKERESGQPLILQTLGKKLEDHPYFSQFKEQFLDLAKQLDNSHHYYFPQVLDWFEEENKPYIVYEYISGLTLTELIEYRKRIPENEALRYINQISEALKILHDAGLQHQNIKPQNLIWRGETNELILVDFNIIRQLTPKIKQPLNQLEPGYAALEQYRSQNQCSPATDIYALAATLYYLLTGEVPPSAKLRQEISWLGWQKFDPNISPKVRQAILSGLEISADKRPQTIEEWLSLLPSSTISEDINYPLQFQLNSKNRKPVKTRILRRRQSKTRRAFLQFICITGAIAASTGVGFGCAVRFNLPHQAGSTILHPEQSFPPRQEWPISNSPNL